MLPLIHYLHLLFGILWLGGTLILALAVFPALARLPAAQARETLGGISRAAGPMLGASGGLTAVLGPLRAWYGGGITRWSDFLYPYAQLVVAAFLIMWVVVGVGASFRKRFEALMADPARFAAEAPALARRDGLIEAVLMLVILAIMVVLGLGLY